MLPAILALAVILLSQAEPIRLHPDNPHDFLFRGRPTLLLTSGEHYGAVLNLDFDHAPYLDELQRRRFNLTRTFSGTYREVPGSFKIRDNTLAPRAGRYQSPWMKTGEKYDLDHFDPAYFERLRSFVKEAGQRGIVVELVLFCPFYNQDLWDVNPMNARNNVNDIGNVPREEVYTLKHPDLLKRQLAFVDRVVKESNEFDNIYFEICNEPYFGGVTLDWQARVASRIVAAEKNLPHKHLIAQNIANDKARIENPNPVVSIFNFHYATPPVTVGLNYALNKPIADDETGFRGTGDRAYRTEAWEFFLAGGSVYSHLDYSFTPEHEDGTARVEAPTPGGGGPTLRSQLAFLKKWLERFEFTRMKPSDAITIDRGMVGDARVWCLAEPGRQYGAYLRGGRDVFLKLDLPDGTYAYGLIDPRDGHSLGGGSLLVHGAGATLELPSFAEDIALAIRRVEGPGDKP